MHTPRKLDRNERGGGLLMALLVIVALAAITAGIVMTVSTDRRATSYNMTRASALNLAESGVAEAWERIRMGDVPDNRNPRMVSQIYLADEGSLPSYANTDTIALPTKQPAGAWLPYSSASKDTFALTVKYMTNSAQTGIYYYDKTKSPPIQGKTGYPIYVIHAVGRDGLSRRVVDTSIAQLGIVPNLKGAYVSADQVKFHGSNFAMGYDYKAETPYGTGYNCVRDGTYETTTNNAAGVWTTNKVDLKAPSKIAGAPTKVENGTTFYAGPWEALNMTQADFFNWLGPAVSDWKNDVPLPSGITYLNDKGDKPGKGNKTYRFSGGDGDGFLYVNGNLEIKGNFTFRGLIYVEGDVNFKGTGWVLGSVVVTDHSKLAPSHKNTCTFVLSNQAVAQFLQRHRTPFTTLTWRES
jgi:Tfp pilus assembly protein PilX